MAEIEKTEAFRTEVILWIIVAVSLLLFISNMGFGGVVGRGVSHILFGLFGLMAYVLPVLLLVGSFFAVSNKGNFHASVKLLAGSIFALFMCMFMSLAISSGEVLDPIQAFTYCADRKNGGGIVGGFLAFYLVKAFGFIGSYIIDIIVLIVCLVLITEKSALKGMQKGGQKVYESAKENNERYKEYREYKAQERQKRRMDHKVSGVSIDTKIEGKKSKNKKSDELGEITDTQDLPKVKKSDKIALSADSQETVASDVSKVEPVFAGEIFPPAEPVISGDFVEDDVPLAKASSHGYYEQMLEVIKAMMTTALKDNAALCFSIVTGCLRISKESIFTGTNNFVLDTITDARLDEYFGFTQKDVDKILSDAGVTEYAGQVKEWYDGYHFGECDVYCPWDVMNYFQELQHNPDAKENLLSSI